MPPTAAGTATPITDTTRLIRPPRAVHIGVRDRSNEATAFGFRDAHTLAAPLIIYNSIGKAQDNAVRKLGNQLRDIIREGTGSEELHTYVNYAYGNEGPEAWYGHAS
ncbi:hypothetical protein AA0119_g12806 [Alternaria tenuissima]|uniref:Uncharacterized protein n=2 Tax=Alternaria alternata complex TaxID=187734 RepID=A0A4Q4MYI0_ALTAL|nr:hypothetical protein AA0115_g12718 [Alternaria tenuissima]RYN63453.1 hypothetical protein AA0117_g12769 [Alternaria alternata]RYN26133.1 hypothetical protein AA0114_g12649 [Alternaria tenuissima]RYN86528.1 hypothetical protein AA0119_g12806 [Alternaria tenuissima]RYO03927.1 hypothetical protein AA0121_g12974 [Alternaria tenuissima]